MRTPTEEEPKVIPASAITCRPGKKPGSARFVVVLGPDAPIHESYAGYSLEIEVPRQTARALAKTLKDAADK